MRTPNSNSLSIPLPQKARSSSVSISAFIGNILLLLIFVSLTFKYQLRVPGKGYYATLANLLIIILGYSWVIFKLQHRIARIKTRLDVPFFIFSTVIIIGLAKGVLSYGLSQDYLGDMRYFIQFLFFFVVTSLRFDKTSFSNFITKLFIILIISSIIVSTYSILTGIFHFQHALDTANPWQFNILHLEDVERSAYLIPGNILLIIPVILISLLYLNELPIWQFTILFTLDFLGIFFTLTRTIWIGVIISIICFFLLNMKRKLFLKIFPLSVSLILVIFFLGHVHVAPSDIINMRMSRASVQSPEQLASLAHRVAESVAFYKLFLKNPVFGAGLGATITFYSAVFLKVVTRSNWHNAYMMLLGKLGILGFWGFLYILWRVFRESVYIIRHDANERTKILMKAFIAILVSLTITTAVISSLISYDFTILFVTLCAIIGIYGHYLRSSLKA